MTTANIAIVKDPPCHHGKVSDPGGDAIGGRALDVLSLQTSMHDITAVPRPKGKTAGFILYSNGGRRATG